MNSKFYKDKKNFVLKEASEQEELKNIIAKANRYGLSSLTDNEREKYSNFARGGVDIEKALQQDTERKARREIEKLGKEQRQKAKEEEYRKYYAGETEWQEYEELRNILIKYGPTALNDEEKKRFVSLLHNPRVQSFGMSKDFQKDLEDRVKRQREQDRQGYITAPGHAHLLPKEIPADYGTNVEEEEFLDIMNIVLDVVGVLDPTGIADLTNMALYAARGKYIDAFFSFVGAAIPYIGDTGKIVKLFAKAPLELIAKIFEGFRKYAPRVEKLLSWCKTKPALKEVVFLIEGTLEKGPKWLSEVIDKKGIKQLGGEIITPKIAEAQIALTLKGQKQLFKASPIAKSFEYAIGASIIPANIEGIFMTKIKNISTQAQLLEKETLEKFGGPGLVTIETGAGTKQISTESYAKALQVYYILNLSNSIEMKATIFKILGLSLESARAYLDVAKQFGYVNNQTAESILSTMAKIDTEKESTSKKVLGSIGEILNKIIPSWVEQAQSKMDSAKAVADYERNKVFKKAQSFQPQASELSYGEAEKQLQSIKNSEKQKTEYEKIRQQQKTSGTLPVELPTGF